MKKLVGLLLFISAFLIVNNIFSWVNFLVIPLAYLKYLMYANAVIILLGGFFAIKTLKMRGGSISGSIAFVGSILIAVAMFYYGSELLQGSDRTFFGPLLTFLDIVMGIMQFDILLIPPTNQAPMRRR